MTLNPTLKKKKEPHKFMQLLTTKIVKSVMKSTPKKKKKTLIVLKSLCGYFYLQT